MVDNSSAFRMDPTVPLVVPEVNPEAALRHKGVFTDVPLLLSLSLLASGIIANPNCTTIIMNVPVHPLHVAAGVSRLVVSTYQAASGAGQLAMDELIQQSMSHWPFFP